MSKLRIKYIVVIIVSCAALALLGLYIARFEFRKPVLDVYFWHLNRGRSIFIRTPSGKTILIDGGQSGDVMRELTGVFPFYRRRIDLLVVTSELPKNVGGLSEVANRFQIGEIVEPEMMGTSTALFAFHRIVEEKQIEIQKVAKGDEFELADIHFRVLFPDPSFKFNKTSLPELVLDITSGSTRMLFLGDVSKTIQKSFISEVGKMSVAEYAHAAAKSRVSAELLEVIDPDFTVTSKREQTVHLMF